MLKIRAPACLGFGVQRLQRCEASQGDGASEESNFSHQPEAGVGRGYGVISHEITITARDQSMASAERI